MKHCYLFLVALLFVSTGYGQENILLEEYMPKSIYKIPETKVEKAKYPVIDAHSHDYPSSKSGKTKRTFLQKRNGSKLAKTKRSKIDKRTVQKSTEKNIFLRCFFIARLLAISPKITNFKQ